MRLAGMGVFEAAGCGRAGAAFLIPRNCEAFPIHLSRFWSTPCLYPWHMATARPLAPPAAEAENGVTGGIASEMAAEQALVPSPPQVPKGSGMVLQASVARLPVELEVSVPVRNFRVRNLLALEPAQVIESGWGHGDDVPLASGPVQLAWSEFEVIDTQLAVRVTRLA